MSKASTQMILNDPVQDVNYHGTERSFLEKKEVEGTGTEWQNKILRLNNLNFYLESFLLNK